MTEQIMMDGEELKAGDCVWCFFNGWMIVDDIIKSAYLYPVICKKTSGLSYSYTKDFKVISGGNRLLYWDEVKVIPPNKPKLEVK